jgi:hypothetical protein
MQPAAAILFLRGWLFLIIWFSDKISCFSAAGLLCDIIFYELVPSAYLLVWLNVSVWIFDVVLL